MLIVTKARKTYGVKYPICDGGGSERGPSEKGARLSAVMGQILMRRSTTAFSARTETPSRQCRSSLRTTRTWVSEKSLSLLAGWGAPGRQSVSNKDWMLIKYRSIHATNGHVIYSSVGHRQTQLHQRLRDGRAQQQGCQPTRQEALSR